MAERGNLISTGELNESFEDANLRIVDCRFDLADPDAGRRLYLAGHIPGAVFADLDRDLAAPVRAQTGRHPLPSVPDFEGFLGQSGIDNATQVVVYDDAIGALASRAWWMLRWMGHERVRLLDGGITAWRSDGLVTRSGSETTPPASFRAKPRDELILRTVELMESREKMSQICLVDARDTQRFCGEIEPIDPVAGHIPGAISLPLTRSVNDDGTWKTREQLEALWQPVLGEDRTKRWAVMCGSGVTACHLALSGMEAGYREPRLYVGSWSEWIRDPGRAVAVGPG